MKNILLSNDFYFDGGYIKDQDQIISKYDITNDIAGDTTEITTEHQEMLSLIKQNEILRDKQKPVKLVVEREDFNSSAFTKTTVYNIAQDNVIIGSIVKRHFQNSNSQRVDYDVYEKLYEPANGKSEVGICRVTSTFIDLEFKTVVDGKAHEIDIPDKYNAQNALAIYLIREGYL